MSYQELTGDDIPYHLRATAVPLGVCDRCGRESWTPNEHLDTLTQPNGQPCGGTFR